MVMGFLTSIVNASNHANCILSRYQKCMTQPIIINLHHNKYSQEFHYYPFAAKLDRCVRSYNILNKKYVIQIKQKI